MGSATLGAPRRSAVPGCGGRTQGNLAGIAGKAKAQPGCPIMVCYGVCCPSGQLPGGQRACNVMSTAAVVSWVGCD